MATNKLFEAAADILSGSKKSASAMPPQKLEGEVVDLGGPTPQNYKNDDNSAKIDATKAAKSATAPTTKPSDASSDTQLKMATANKPMKEESKLEESNGKITHIVAKSDLEKHKNWMDSEGYETHTKPLPATHPKHKTHIGIVAGKNSVEHSYHEDGYAHPIKEDIDRVQQIEEDIAAWKQKVISVHGKDVSFAKKRHLDGSTYHTTATTKSGRHVGNYIHSGSMKGGHVFNKSGSKVVEETEVDFSDDINQLFADDSTISEDFKTKATTIFEARVLDRVQQIEEELNAQYTGMLEEAIETLKNDLTEKVNDYLSYVVEQWMEQNEIAVETGLRSELTEDFIGGLRNLFAEHYINVPEDKVDLVEELAGKVEALESKLNEEIERNVELKKELNESRKAEIINTVCENLTATQVEKIKSLAESVEFSGEDEYKEKLETIRENYFPTGIKKAEAKQLNEEIVDDPNKTVVTDPFVASVMQSISKTVVK